MPNRRTSRLETLMGCSRTVKVSRSSGLPMESLMRSHVWRIGCDKKQSNSTDSQIAL